jgi:hypothetical protein
LKEGLRAALGPLTRQKAAKEQEPYNWSPKSARYGNKDQQKRLVPEETAFVDALQLPDSARIRIKGCRASDNQTCGALLTPERE